MLKKLIAFVKSLKTFDLILLMVAVSVPVFVFVFFRRGEEFTEIRLRVTDKDILYANTSPNLSYVDSFRVGDVEKNELGQVIAEITNVESLLVTRTNSITYLTIRVKSLHNPRKGVYSLRGKPIIYGESFKFNFQNAVVEGLVVDYPGYQKAQSEVKKIIVETQVRYDSRQFSDVYGVPIYVANTIQEGDRVEDSQGVVIAKVLEKRVSPAKRTVLTTGGAVTQTIDPELRDVFLTLELTVNKKPQGYFLYDLLPVAVAESIPLNFAKYSIFPTILNIIDNEENQSTE